MDCRSYTYVNSHRADLQTPRGYVNYISDWKCMSARDIGPARWDHDFMQLDGGDGGKVWAIHRASWMPTGWRVITE